MTSDSFAYVGNADSNDISVFRLTASSGAMTPVETVPLVGLATPGPSTPLAITPDKRFLIAGLRAEPFKAVSFAIDTRTGRLTPVGEGPLADSMCSLATDRTGRFLFSASYGGSKIAVQHIGRDGVAEPPRQVTETGLNAHCIQVDPQNRNVFVTNLGSDQVLAFALDAESGAMHADPAATTKVPAKAGPRHFVFGPDGRFVYLLNELDGSVMTFAYDSATAGWRELQRTTSLPEDFSGQAWAADIHTTPDGRFLYASERTTSTIKAFRIDPASGLLSDLGSMPTEQQPRGFQIDPTGRYLAAVGEMSHSMTVHAIDQTSGALTRLAAYPTGKRPNWVEFVRAS